MVMKWPDVGGVKACRGFLCMEKKTWLHDDDREGGDSGGLMRIDDSMRWGVVNLC